jgi:hypothetical protein
VGIRHYAPKAKLELVDGMLRRSRLRCEMALGYSCRLGGI